MKLIKYIFVLFIGFSIVIGGLFFYAFKIEPFRIDVETYQLSAINESNQKIKVVQFSDVHVSDAYPISQLDKVVESINQQTPDIVVFTGDLYDNYASYLKVDEVIESLSKINSSIGKYAIWGNRDYGGGAVRIYEYVMEQSGFILLKNETISIHLEDDKIITLSGLDDVLLGQPNVDVVKQQLNQKSDYQLLLVHEPDIADDFLNTSLNLILAGHSHGGQVDLIVYKGVSTKMAEKYSRGFYQLSDSLKLYVNRGLGTSRINIRFNVPPEITVFNIQL